MTQKKKRRARFRSWREMKSVKRRRRKDVRRGCVVSWVWRVVVRGVR